MAKKPANKVKKKKQRKKSGVPPQGGAAAGAPQRPIFILGANGELERCDWDVGMNRYVCRPVQGAQIPAGALQAIRMVE
jgi:hypothetical protein